LIDDIPNISVVSVEECWSSLAQSKSVAALVQQESRSGHCTAFFQQFNPVSLSGDFFQLFKEQIAPVKTSTFSWSKYFRIHVWLFFGD
jgi:hypothetical protein